MEDFRNLKVWTKADALIGRIYEATQSFPVEERYAMTRQVRNAAVSIPTNIAEGCGRNGDREFRRFLYIALGSACEVDSLLLSARRVRFLTEAAHAELDPFVQEVKRMLWAFIRQMKC